jgi:2-dehydro-3-deoxygalactonokinase
MPSPTLIALDWGTTQARAALLDAAGATLATRSAPVGVMNVRDGRFDEALDRLLDDWPGAPLRPGGSPLPLIASGMIGSRQGWREASYLPCPAGPAEAAARLTTLASARRGTLHIVPGLVCTGADGQADVMRGEETQLWGAGLAPGSLCVLPGTHSKWAWMGADQRIERFATYMTGELYGVLSQHSILGRLMEPGSEDAAAFAEGVRHGLAGVGAATHALFAVRTAGLTGRIAPAGLPEYLSGMLIGFEIGGATRAPGQSPPALVTLLGEPALCARYEKALALAGIACAHAPAQATVRGQWALAVAAGLVPPAPRHAAAAFDQEGGA